MTDAMLVSIMRLLKPIVIWLAPFVAPFLIYKLVVVWRQCITAKRTQLKDKVVLITGASSGLGEALAHAFHAAGCKIILAARRMDELKRVQEALLASDTTVQSHRPCILSLDLSDLKSIPLKAEEVVRLHGVVDILVNNSGISCRSDVMSTSLDVDLNLMLINYFGHITLTKALLTPMIQNGGGHIVAISSVQGRIAIPHRSSYAASKHAMQAFFDTLRAEVHGKNIKVTVVSPGYVRTNLSINAMTGTGAKYGVMDSTTASGLLPQVAAARILDAIMQNDSEIILAPFSNKLAIILRAVCPRLYFYLMEKKAQKSERYFTTNDRSM